MSDLTDTGDQIYDLQNEIERLTKIIEGKPASLGLIDENMRLQARVEALEYVIQMTHASIYCHDGYRGIGISEEAESLLNEALAAKENDV